MQLKIAHLTPHLNGGLGKVLCSTLQYFNIVTKKRFASHHVFLYDVKCSAVIPEGLDNYIKYIINFSKIREALEGFDIVQVEFWNHPLIYSLISSGFLDSCRLVGCAHVQGETPPQLITRSCAKYFSKMLLTGKCTDGILSQTKMPSSHFAEITFPIDFSRVRPAFKSSSSNPKKITIGYIGTLSYAKLDRSFLDICSKVPGNPKFLVAGEDDNSALELEAEKRFPCLDIDFLGKVDDISTIFEKLDIFMYPLQSDHYGTGELALVEALYSGVPVVAYNNFSEGRVIENGRTGLLAKDTDEFIFMVQQLCDDPDLRLKLGVSANNFVSAKYSTDRCFAHLHGKYTDIFSASLSASRDSGFQYEGCSANEREYYGQGFILFLESLKGSAGTTDLFLSYINEIRCGDENSISSARGRLICFLKEHPGFIVNKKGGIGHYLHVFAEDKDLIALSLLLKSIGQ